jgi:LuxR family maltose regulon positive regulatory protein
MRTGTSSLPVAKLSPPVQPRVVSRPRLFRKIDRGRQLGCVWIAGPAGAGKTTLVASYLEAKRHPNVWYRLDEGDRDLASVFHYLALAFDRASPCRRPPLPARAPDHQHDLPTFVRRFFERAGARLRTPLVLVFDNYQDVAAEAALHELLPVGVSALPRHVAVVIVSRDSPPPSFASLEVGRGLTYVSPDDLTLTAREMSRLVSLHVPRASRRQALELRRSATLAHGWAAGAVLLLEQARTGGATDPGDAAQASPTLFSYLAKEVVARLPEECQTLLLKTCVLPEMTTSMAVALSERPSAKEHLARLYRTRNFTERVQRAEPWYGIQSAVAPICRRKSAPAGRNDDPTITESWRGSH